MVPLALFLAPLLQNVYKPTLQQESPPSTYLLLQVSALLSPLYLSTYLLLQYSYSVRCLTTMLETLHTLTGYGPCPLDVLVHDEIATLSSHLIGS